MKLGEKGLQLVDDIAAQYTDSASLCTSFQQEFFESFKEKADKFGDSAYISEKQLVQLNKIADIYGIPTIKEDDLDTA